MKTVIAAGGKGTRIAGIAQGVPKPMIPVCGRPILEHQLACLKRQGFQEFIFTVGHMASQVMNYFCDGSKWGVSIQYYIEETPLGTAGALNALKQELKEDFLYINGDLIFDIDIEAMLRFHREKQALATLLTHPNDHPYDSAILETNQNAQVVRWLNKEDHRDIYENRVNAGIHILSPKLFDRFNEISKLDLDRDILKPEIANHTVYGYASPEYVRDMGTPERYRQVCRDVADGVPPKRNLKQMQKAVFLDRDGTINRYKGFITRWQDIELLPGVEEAIGRINRSGFLSILVTNQPVIARGECTWEELQNIHRRLQVLLGLKGVFLDDIYICPHHPDSGFPGERAEYKVKCSCRKPEPGLLLQAAQKYNISLSESYMVGDSEADVQAGRAAGCRSIRVGDAAGCQYRSLLDFVNGEIQMHDYLEEQ